MIDDEIFQTLSEFSEKSYASAQQFSQAEWECVLKLRETDKRNPGKLEMLARRLLAQTSPENDSEYRLQVVLRALEGDDATAIEIASAALLSGKTQDKASYVSFLASFGTPVIVPVLVQFLEKSTPVDDEFAEDSSIPDAIEALARFEATQAAPIIAERLTDVSEATRLAAIEYFRFLRLPHAQQAFVNRLRSETDQQCFEAILSALVEWRASEFIPELEALLNEIHYTPELQEALRIAIQRLSKH